MNLGATANAAKKLASSVTTGVPKKPPAKKPFASSWTDVAHEIRANQMLGGYNTQFGNAFDGALNSLTGPIKTFMKAPLSAHRAPEDRTYGIEAAKGVFGMLDGFQRYADFTASRLGSKLHIKNAGESRIDAMKRTGINPDTDVSNKMGIEQQAWSAEKFGLDPNSFMGGATKALGALINIPGSSLNFVDMGMKQVNYGRKQWEQAAHLVKTGEAATQADALVKVRTDKDLMKQAVDEAEYMTYTNQPQMESLKWITSKDADRLPFMRFAVPFRRAIANIFEQGVEHSPLVMASPTLRKNLTSKNPAVADAARSKLAFGMTAMAATGYLLKDYLVGSAPVDDPALVGDAPREYKLGQVFRHKHGGESFLRITDDVKIPLKYMGIGGQWLAQIANLNQWNSTISSVTLTEEGLAKVDKDYAALAVTSLEKFMDGYWGANIVEFNAAISDSIRSEDPTRILKWIEQNTRNMVPFVGNNGFIQYQRRLDPTARETGKMGESYKDMAANTRQDLEYKYSYDGRPSIHSSLQGNKEIMQYWFGGYDEFDDIMLAHQVEFVDMPDKVPAKAQGLPGEIPGQMVEVTKQDKAAAARIMWEGGQGLPSVREYLQMRVLDTPLFTDLYADYPEYRKAALEDAYSGYMSLVMQIVKSDLSPGALGDRIQKIELAQVKHLQAIMQSARNSQ